MFLYCMFILSLFIATAYLFLLLPSYILSLDQCSCCYNITMTP